MITEKIQNALNQQIEMEAKASFLYLSMASWCEREGLEGCSDFLYRQSEEEREHMLRIFHYINDMDGVAKAPGIETPMVEFESIQSLFQMVYEHEKKVTESIHQLVALSYQLADHTTLNFLQWYIEEQREEEGLMRTVLDKIKLIGDIPQSLYFIDMEIQKINAAQAKAAAAEK